MKKAPDKKNFFYYKDKPLVRCNSVIYYGDTHDKYIVKLQIENSENQKNQTSANKVFIKLLKTESSSNLYDEVIKTAEKEELFTAIELADIWLHKALEEVSS